MSNETHLHPEQRQVPMTFFVVLIACIAAIAGILFGYDTGVISGAILFIKPEFHLHGFMYSMVMSSVLIGALLGSGISGRFADLFGRRKLLIVTAAVFVVGTVGSAIAFEPWTLIISRVVVGFAIGIASFTAPLYISEVAPPRYRGALVSLNQLAITIGILVSYAIDIYFSESSQGWRWMFGIGIAPAVLLLIGMAVLPESPRWLVLKMQYKQARKTLQEIRNTRDVDEELNEVKESLTERHSWRMLFKAWLMPAIIVGVGLAFFQQCTGINTIIYFAPTIFQMAGFDTATGAISTTAIMGSANVLFTIIALPLLDFWGRRPMLLVGLIGMGVGLLLMSLSFQFGAGLPILKWLTLISMIIYIACFAMSLGPIMWLVIAEIFPLQVRGLGSSLAISSSWFFNWLVTFTFNFMINGLGQSGTFLTYAILCVVGFVFVKKLVPETKGVSLEFIEHNLRAGKPSRELGEASKY